MRLLISCIVALFLFPSLAPAAEGEAAQVARLQGSATIDGAPLAAGATLASGAHVRTAAGARIELRFRDDTNVVLGEKADFVVVQFDYDPASTSGAARFQVQSGAFLIATGAVGHLPGHPLSVQTPVASIGVRGTRFWGGDLDHPLDVLLLEGAISVRTQAGSVDLEDPLDGTDVRAAGAPPSPVGKWKAPRVDRAMRSVSFD